MTLAVLRATLGASLSQPKIAIIRLGENTAEAARQAGLAAAQVPLAAAQVALAAAQVGLAAGQVALAAGQAVAASGSAAQAAATLASITTLEAAQYRYATKAAANAALAGIPADEFVYVFADETRNGRVTVYRKTGGVLVFHNTLTGEALTWFVDPLTGSDANPGTQAAPFATVTKAMTLAVAGDTVQLSPHAVIKENFADAFQFPAYVRLRGSDQGSALFLNFDALTGPWIADGTAWYQDVAHAFGAVAPAESTKVTIPTLLYRAAPVDKLSWLQLYQAASAAAGIAFVKANPGRLFAADMSGGNSGEIGHGWTIGVHRIYVRLPGDLDPNALDAVLYTQRWLPPFASGGYLENARVFGTFAKDAIACTNGGGYISNVELYYPPHHGFIMAGAQTDRCLVAHGNPAGAGYAVHHFGGEANFQTQKYAHHRAMKVIDWPGEAIGCHGSGGGVDGGGGPDVVMDAIQFDDFYGEDIVGMGDAYQVRTGITFNDARLKDCRRIGAYLGATCTMNNLRLLHTRAHTQPTFCAPSVGKLVLNGGMSYSRGQSLFDRVGGGTGGTIELNEHIVLFGPDGSFFMGGAGAYSVVVNGGIIQANRSAPVSTLEAGPVISFTVNGAILSGINVPRILATQVNTTLTISADTVFGGDAGLKHGVTPELPVLVNPDSGYFSKRERVIASVAVGNGSSFVTNKRMYSMITTYPASVPLESVLFPSDFEPLSAIGASGNVFVGGKAGKLRFVYPDNPDFVQSYVAGIGATEDVTGFARMTSTGRVFVYTWDGATARAYDLTPFPPALVAATAPGGTFPILGGVEDGAGNLLVWGATDNNSVGGARKSTDAGATYSAVDASMTGKPKTGERVNGIFVLAGDFGAYNFWTAATVGGVWTQRPNAMADARSMTVDAQSKRLIFCGSFTGGTSAAGPEASKYGQKDVLYSMDCSAADPANWPFAGAMEAPFGDIHSVVCVAAGIGFVAPSKSQITVFGRTPHYAATFDTVRGGNWTQGKTKGELSRIAGHDTRKTDDFAVAFA